MEVARIVGRFGPARDERTERSGKGVYEVAVATAHREGFDAGRGGVSITQAGRQNKVRRTVGIGHHIPRKVCGAQAELAVVERVGGVVGAIDEDADDDQGTGHEQRRQPHCQPALKRWKTAGDHAPPPTRR